MMLLILKVNNSSNRKLTKSEKAYYRDYAAKIEEYAKGDPERREAAFLNIEKFKLNDVNQAENENKRVNDLVNAFNALCVKEGTINNRIDHKLDKNVEIHYHAKNDNRINAIRDFRKSIEIKVHRGHVLNINPKWFEASHLQTLELTDCSPFSTHGSWETFVKGIAKCTKLHDLNMNNCEISYIPEKLFYSMPISLKRLDLIANDIKQLPLSISKLVNLRSLVLSRNRNLSDDGFPWDSLPTSLASLDLGRTSITTIPEEIKNLSHLNFLQCGNKLTKISWDNLKKDLRILNLNCDGRINLPDSENCLSMYEFELKNAGVDHEFMENLPINVGHLNLSFNKFYIFDCYSNNSTVEVVRLRHNNITFINWIQIDWNLPRLYKLDMAFNKIEIVGHFENMEMKLKYLDIRHNQIKHVDGVYIPLNLTQLNLSSNQISSFSSITSLKNLSRLNLDNNLLTALPDGIENCHHLIDLSCSNNRISSLPVGFENKKRDLLNLSHNSFSVENVEKNLDDSLWNRLPADVEVLILNGNNLQSLPCQLRNKAIWKLEAKNCNIQFICPQIGSTICKYRSNILINIKDNEKLNYLSFAPLKIFQIPVFRKKPNVAPVDEKRMILTTSKTYSNTERFYSYDFLPKPNAPDKFTCGCCALCRVNCSGEPDIETFMVMDFTLVVLPVKAKDNSDDEDDKNEEYDGIIDLKFFYPESPDPKSSKILKPREWKTRVRTKLCKECIHKMKNEIYECENNDYGKNRLKKLFTEDPNCINSAASLNDEIVKANVQAIKQSSMMPTQPFIPTVVNNLPNIANEPTPSVTFCPEGNQNYEIISDSIVAPNFSSQPIQPPNFEISDGQIFDPDEMGLGDYFNFLQDLD